MAEVAAIRHDLAKSYKAVPVFLSKETASDYYSGFCSLFYLPTSLEDQLTWPDRVLWPLLHDMPDKASFNSKWAAKYREVNEIFADNVIPHVENGGLIWIYDYQLLLPPGNSARTTPEKKGCSDRHIFTHPFST